MLLTTNNTDMGSYLTHLTAIFKDRGRCVCVCVCHLSMMVGWQGQVRGESEAMGDLQRRKHCLRHSTDLSVFLSLLLSLTVGKQSSPSPPWQSELRQVIPPSTAKSFTSPTQPWMLLHKANAVWACACVRVCVRACSKYAFWFTGTHTDKWAEKALMCLGCRE